MTAFRGFNVPAAAPANHRHRQSEQPRNGGVPGLEGRGDPAAPAWGDRHSDPRDCCAVGSLTRGYPSALISRPVASGLPATGGGSRQVTAVGEFGPCVTL